MRDGRRFALWPMVMLALLVAGLLGAAAEATGTASAAGNSVFAGLDLTSLEPEKLTAVVERSYQRLAELIGRSGEGIEFELSRFQTFTREELDHVDWLALLDLPEGRVIDVERKASQLETWIDGRREISHRVLYRARWNEHAANLADEAWAADLARRSAADVLREAGGNQPILRGVTAATSVTVRVAFAGEQRSYRAAMFWIFDGGQQRLTAYPLDLVVQGLDLAMAEELLSGAMTDTKESQIRPGSLVPRLGDGRCVESTPTLLQQFLNSTGNDGHNVPTNGTPGNYHYAQATLDTTCTCRSDCTQFCDAAVRSTACADTGGPHTDACHVLRWQPIEVDGSSNAGDSVPASCAAGFGCVKKACTACACANLSITFGGVVGSIQFNFNGSPDWSAQRLFERTCLPCQLAPGSPPVGDGDSNPPGGGGSNPPPGGGGGDVSFGGGGCTPPPLCDSDGNGWVSNSDCVNHCSGYVSGGYCNVPWC